MTAPPHPTVTSASGRRTFACFPVAVLGFIVNTDERILVLKHPQRAGWEVVNGALEAGETVEEGLLREIREEAGPQIHVRPLGGLHDYTFHYDDHVPFMLSVCYLLAYEDGDVIPGDDMQGSRVRWVSADEVVRGDVPILVPGGMAWLFQHAVQVYRLLREAPPVVRQPVFGADHTNKHGGTY
jgi:8-oxo-dGTP diphosphatase